MNRNKIYNISSSTLRYALTSVVMFLASTAGLFADESGTLKSDSPKTGLLTIEPFKLPSDGLSEEERASLKAVQRIVKILSESTTFDEALERTEGIPHEIWSELATSASFHSISFTNKRDIISGRNLFGVTLIGSKGAVDLTLDYLFQRDLQELIDNRKTSYIEPTATYWSIWGFNIVTFGSKEIFHAVIHEDYEYIEPDKPIDFANPLKSQRPWWHLSEICYNVSKDDQSPFVMKRTNITSQDIKEILQRGSEEIYYTKRRCFWSDRELVREMFLDAPVPLSYFYENDKPKDDMPEIKRKNVSVTWED